MSIFIPIHSMSWIPLAGHSRKTDWDPCPVYYVWYLDKSLRLSEPPPLGNFTTV